MNGSVCIGMIHDRLAIGRNGKEELAYTLRYSYLELEMIETVLDFIQDDIAQNVDTFSS